MTLQHLITEVTFSTAVVVLEQSSVYRFVPVWFFLIHTIILSFFTIRLILLKSGKEIIEKRDTEVQAKISLLQSMSADLSAILEKMPDIACELQPVLDAIRYSDPMSHTSLLPYENVIKDSITQLEQTIILQDKKKIPSLCIELLHQIKDRNNRVKILK
jgi:hypothetical protein